MDKRARIRWLRIGGWALIIVGVVGIIGTARANETGIVPLMSYAVFALVIWGGSVMRLRARKLDTGR